MKQTVQLLIGVVLWYLYGYKRKQSALHTQVHGKWKTEKGCLTLRTSGIISWETTGRKPIFGYYELQPITHKKQEKDRQPEEWLLRITIQKQQLELTARVEQLSMELHMEKGTYPFERIQIA